MKIALIQQHATDDKAINIQRGLDNIDTALPMVQNWLLYPKLGRLVNGR